MLVMGSMIGSGIFIVSAEIGREVDSPALLIGAWAVAGFMTIVAALSYGELAAMMPRAGGQYVYLREALGPLWGFLYGWTLFLVIQTGTIAAVGVAFGKFLAYSFHRFLPLTGCCISGKFHRFILAPWFWAHGRGHQHPESGGDPAGDFPVGGEYLWIENGRRDSEHLHRGESCGAAGPRRIWIGTGTERAGSGLELGSNFWHNAGLGAQHAFRSALVGRS